MMKRLFYILIVVFISCGGDDEPNMSTLEGIIDGETFTFGEARYQVGSDSRLSIDIFSANNVSTNVCTNVAVDVYIFFRADDSLDQQDLFLDLNSFEGFTVTLFNPKTTTNIIATDGYFKITERTDESFTAELEANFDSETNVSGVFVAELCN